MILYHATSTHNHSVSDCSGDWSTSDHSNRSWTYVSRPWFLLRTDPASEKLGITSLSAGVQWVSCRCAVGLLQDGDEGLVLIGYLLNGRDLVCSKTLGVRLEYIGSWVIFGSISAAAPWEGCFMTHPTLNTSSAGSSGCSHIDRFSWHL